MRSRTQNAVHTFLLAVCFTLINWLVVSTFVIPDLGLLRYIVVEVILVVSLKLYTLVVQKYLTSTND
jgi:hypothetical protein